MKQIFYFFLFIFLSSSLVCSQNNQLLLTYKPWLTTQIPRDYFTGKSLQLVTTATAKNVEEEEYIFVKKVTLQSIVQFTWQLYNIALRKGKAFTEGTFVIHDPCYAAYHFLKSYEETYPRFSSHFLEHFWLRDGLFQHSGIDIPRHLRYDRQLQLPNDKYHVLFGNFCLHNVPITWLKLEAYGTGSADILGHTHELVTGTLPRAFGLLPDDKALWCKERIPGSLLQIWREFIISVQPLHTEKIIQEQLRQGTTYGYAQMLAGYNALRSANPTESQQQVMKKFIAYAQNNFNQEYDHQSQNFVIENSQAIRKAHEIIITHEELQECLPADSTIL